MPSVGDLGEPQSTSHEYKVALFTSSRGILASILDALYNSAVRYVSVI
jgi:hypothetical protein